MSNVKHGRIRSWFWTISETLFLQTTLTQHGLNIVIESTIICKSSATRVDVSRQNQVSVLRMLLYSSLLQVYTYMSIACHCIEITNLKCMHPLNRQYNLETDPLYSDRISQSTITSAPPRECQISNQSSCSTEPNIWQDRTHLIASS